MSITKEVPKVWIKYCNDAEVQIYFYNSYEDTVVKSPFISIKDLCAIRREIDDIIILEMESRIQLLEKKIK